MQISIKNKGLSLLLLNALCWGPAYLFIKIAVADIPPVTLALLRVAIASLVLYGVCLWKKQSLLAWKHLWPQFAVMGITLNAIPFFLISFGEQYISSTLTGVIISLSLIFTMILAHFFGRDEVITRNKILGSCAGLAGLCIIYLPLIAQESVKSQLGVLTSILASCSIGAGTVYARKHLQKAPLLVALTMQLILSTLILLPLSLLVDQPFSLPFPPASSLWGVIALAMVSTVAAYYFYLKNIELTGATYASLALIILPIFAIILGGVFLKEQFTWNLCLGTLFILGGVGAVNPTFCKK